MQLAISKRAGTDIENDAVVDETNLLPPLNFHANILDAQNVRLEWNVVAVSATPNFDQPSPLYYILNIRELRNAAQFDQIEEVDTSNNILRQEIKVESNHFLMRHLKAGRRYEITIRSARNPDNVSSAAAILEIRMPNGRKRKRCQEVSEKRTLD